MEAHSVTQERENEEMLRLIEEEERLEEQLAELLECMTTVNTALMHERHAGRMLQVDKNWLLSRNKS